MNSETTLSPMSVGRYINAEGLPTPLPYSSEEAERARRAITRVLNTFHFRTGSNIMITALFHEGAQLMPLERAVMSYGMVAVSADSSPYDAKRVESIARRFKLAGAAGISADTLAGLEQLGFKPEDVFANMVVWARSDAYEQLKAIPALDVYRLIELGPAVAIECSHGTGAHIDRFEWTTEEQNGEIVLTNRLARSTPFKQYKTGVKGRILHGACQCGNADPRIELNP
jgi:phenylacetate-coenzyme A ligase PaaK-like adenylate-forming protein